PFEAQRAAREEERIARRKLLQEIFLHLAERHPAPREARRPPVADQPHVQHRLLDDRAEVQPVLLRDRWMRNPPPPILHAPDAGVALIGPERITACRYKIDNTRKRLSVEIGIGC